VLELGPKLGPILWQFPPSKAFEPADFAAFLGLLPKQRDGHRIRHAVEVRHPSFVSPDFIRLMREHTVAVAAVDSDKHPLIADATGDVVYLRLQRTAEDELTGYPAGALSTWAERAKAWAAGRSPDDLPTLGPAPPAAPREVFIYMISGAKVRAPAAAMALIERLA
jgi:uncharacterized protein YecE (DUF72 family)